MIETINRVKVLIVDDSALVRKILSEELESDPEICVVGTAPDAYIAREKLIKLMPDIMLLDIEMPRMNGLDFLEALMRHYPIPVIVISSMLNSSAQLISRAYALGAADVIAKPGSSYSVGAIGTHLREKIKMIACRDVSQA
jgi:two-component system chemotaxis response regulator CheB